MKIIFGLGLIVIITIFLVAIFSGIHFETGQGKHTGYVTAVQKQGIIFKTGRAYVKTETESSQEDIYCVVDTEIFKELQEISENNERVIFNYKSWLLPAIKECAGESDIIFAIEKINK